MGARFLKGAPMGTFRSIMRGSRSDLAGVRVHISPRAVIVRLSTIRIRLIMALNRCPARRRVGLKVVV
jgi:hypothetical protein